MNKYFLFINIFLVLIGCSQNTSVNFDNGAVGQPIVITTFQGAAETSWVKDGSGTIYTTSRTVTFSGTCVRLVQSIIVKVDGTANGSPKSCTDGAFTWAYTFGADATHTVSFVPVLVVDGQESTVATVTKNMTIDTVAPAAPVITTNGGANMVITTPNVTINGTTSADTYNVTIADAGTLTFSQVGQTFQLDTTLLSGQSKTLSFYALDFAGNVSTADSIQVYYEPSILMSVSESSGSGLEAPATDNNLVLVSVTVSPFLTATPIIVSTPDNHKHFSGVTNVAAKNQ